MKRKTYPEQTELASGQRIKSKHGALGHIVRTQYRNAAGFRLYKVQYRMKLGGVWQTFRGSALFTAEEILNCCRLLKGDRW